MRPGAREVIGILESWPHGARLDSQMDGDTVLAAIERERYEIGTASLLVHPFFSAVTLALLSLQRQCVDALIAAPSIVTPADHTTAAKQQLDERGQVPGSGVALRGPR